MIRTITGTLAAALDASIDLTVGPMTLGLLVPACDLDHYRARIGRDVELHTLLYLEGDASRGNLEPRLIGFLSPEDRAFFDLFTTVKGIGPKTALRALIEPVGTIAAHIESRDARALTKLPGIGKRTAELIVAELAGKCVKFVTGPIRPVVSPTRTIPTGPDEDALQALIRLGERRSDAEVLLTRARASLPESADLNQLVTEMLRQRAAR
jgi:Holliday junction DNA helicase RuvA